MTNHQKSVFGKAKSQLKTINNKNQKNKVTKTKITRKNPHSVILCTQSQQLIY